MLQNQITQIDITKYPETCEKCLWPARSEYSTEPYPNDGEWWMFCVNPKCINFDGIHLRQVRARLERQVRESKTYERYQKRLWALEIKRYKSLKQQSHELQPA